MALCLSHPWGRGRPPPLCQALGFVQIPGSPGPCMVEVGAHARHVWMDVRHEKEFSAMSER